MITATILTKNSAKHLHRILLSLCDFPEVILVDTGSTDNTIAIAEQFSNVKIYKSDFIGFGPLHNLASSYAQNDWILSIDSDEEVTPELAKEIFSLSLDPGSVYAMQRDNFYNGKQIKWCGGWYPDWVIRIYNRKSTSFTTRLVHEQIDTSEMKIIHLKAHLSHTPYLEISDFLSKMQLYSSLFAEQNTEKSSSIWRALFHSWHAFIKSYFFKRGFMGGKEGLIISLYNGHTAFYKYLKLAERVQKKLP